MFTCTKCGETKSVDSFCTDKSIKRGHRSICKQCYAIYMKEYFKKKPAMYERQKEYSVTKHKNYNRHRIGKQKFDVLMNTYNGKCWICKDKDATQIDHDHNCCNTGYSCGKCVRGVVCNKCNSTLRSIENNLDTIKNFINYLELQR